MAHETLIKAGVPVAGILDRAAKPGMAIAGVPVCHPDTTQLASDAPLLVTTVSTTYGPLAQSLRERGWANVLPFYDFALVLDGPCQLTNGWFAGALGADDERETTLCLAGLADAPSRAAYLQHLAWRIRREDWRFQDAPVEKENRYWIQPILAALSGSEEFVDGGAYDGRVFGQLLERTHGDFSKAHLIEPDRRSCDALWTGLSGLSAEQQQKVNVLPVALGDRRAPAPFNGGHGYASRLGNGPDEVTVTTLDALDVKPTFVKLHLEGDELAALEGGVVTLQRCRPKIAATVYHNRDGLWRTLRFLMVTLENYLFYFRLHAWCATGAVAYAIPAEAQP